MIKLAHVSDIHIRNLKYHDDYRKVFEDFYRKLDIFKPDAVVNTGDLAHTKTQISPEYVEMTSEFHRRILEYCELWEILGNHDMNLMNPDRQDAVTPVVDSIKDPRIHLMKKSGLHVFRKPSWNAPGVNFWVFSLADQKNYPTPGQWAEYCSDINIGLFHGSIANCVTDSNWRMTHVEHDLDLFSGLDYVLMGDIHKQQNFNDGRAWYAGSMIQQNFGEDPEKGFLLWRILDKRNFRVEPVMLDGNRKFFTVKLNDDLTFPADTKALSVPDSHIRISPPRALTLVEQKAVEKEARKLYKPHDIITLAANSAGSQKHMVGKKVIDGENLRSLAAQEKLIRDFLKEKNLPESVLNKVIDLNRRYQVHVEQKDDTARNIVWKINRIIWSNLFNYGEGNVIDFDALGGLTGLFAPNASGKSNLIDVLMETVFDSTTKGVSKNISLINDNEDQATMVADITANGQQYVIERTIERIKYGQRKFTEEKEWGKTAVNFAMVDDAGEQQALVGTLRPETEKNIRQRIGTFDDFMLTSLSAQWNMMDIIACKGTKRKEILYRFIDLDIFEQKAELAKVESKPFVNKLKDLEDNSPEEKAAKYRIELKDLEGEILDLENEKVSIKEEIAEFHKQEIGLNAQKVKDVPTGFKEMLEQGVASCLREIHDLEDSEKKYVTEISRIDSELTLSQDHGFDEKEHDKANSAFSEANQKLVKLGRSVTEKEQSIRRHEKTVSLLDEVPCGDMFPNCKFLLDAFKSRGLLPKMNEELVQLRVKHLETSNQLDELGAAAEQNREKLRVHDVHKKLQAQKESVQLKLENARLRLKNVRHELDKKREKLAALEKAEADIRKNKEIDGKILEVHALKSAKEVALAERDSELRTLTRQIGAVETNLKKVEEEMKSLRELRDTVTAYEHYLEAMGKDGIPYQVLTQKLPLINEEINKILGAAADFSVSIEHDPDEQSIRFYIQYGQYKQRLLELGSGAEKMLASVAIRTALLSISNLPKTNMFIIDEGFGKLDPKNLEAIQRMFDYLKSVFDHVIVISHLDTMKDMVDNIIEITTDDRGYAHVEIGT